MKAGAREILAMEDRIRQVSRDLLAAFKTKSSGDFTEDVALPPAFDTALSVVGAPPEDAPYFIEHLACEGPRRRTPGSAAGRPGGQPRVRGGHPDPAVGKLPNHLSQRPGGQVAFVRRPVTLLSM